ncbi:Protein priB [Termitomyces sp. J132]|nr:Protein priB [Termitomyces sp. J132]
MRCVGAEEGQKCQRCKRANVDCIFEKHRRGRKPGSKLSEASKMLRRLEKGLNSAKMKSQAAEMSGSTSAQEYGASRSSDGPYQSSGSHFNSKELPPLNVSHYPGSEGYQSNGSRAMEMDDEDDADRNEETIFPEGLIRRENQRNSFFRTILNPEADSAPPSGQSNHNSPLTPPLPRIAPLPSGLNDPITAGIITEEDAKVLFDAIFLRLNPFINLFDPALHSVAYVRSKCPFLFTTLIMAGCKFFRHESYKQCQKLANDFAVRAFAEGWKRVEVVQAFACLTYWKEPDENRTWTYIGYACRMAVELKLNRYRAHPPPNETPLQLLERRNCERTYLVLFVHDRSLATQTGRHWMLPEDDMIRHSSKWHEQVGAAIRPEDVIVAAFVQLRIIAVQTTDIFKGAASGAHHDINYEAVLKTCNQKLTEWADKWQHEMDRANGDKFHSSFLSFFRLYVRVFLNSFAVSPANRQSPSLQAVTLCCTSALDALQIVSRDFARMSMLRYGQDSIMVMSAYCAVFLLKLLRSSAIYSQLNENTAKDIYDLISATAEAYHNASLIAPESSAATHARFLRSLVSNDVFVRRNDPKHEMAIDPQLEPSQQSIHPPAQTYYGPVPPTNDQVFPASPNMPPHPANAQPPPLPLIQSYSMASAMNNSMPMAGVMSYGYNIPQMPQYTSELDAHYWKNMFIELGFGESEENQVGMLPPQVQDRTIHGHGHYAESNHHMHQQHAHHHHSHGHASYQQHMHQPSQSNNYGH